MGYGAGMVFRFLSLAALLPLAALAQPVPPLRVGCPQFFFGGAPPAFVNPRLGQGAVLLCNEAYAVAASPTSRGALWSAEHLTAAGLDAARQVPREDAFHPDDRLAPGSRGELADYRDTGYDRGHMAPSGDMPTAEAQQQSFSLANMVPQTPELNRGVWEGIESAVRRLATGEGELYVVTGPAFVGNRISAVGPDQVLVPSATWKAVYDPRANGAGAYVCPNTKHPACRTVALAALSRAVGVDPFPALPAALKAQLTALPPPEDSPYAPGSNTSGRRERRNADRGFFDQLLNPSPEHRR